VYEALHIARAMEQRQARVIDADITAVNRTMAARLPLPSDRVGVLRIGPCVEM